MDTQTGPTGSIIQFPFNPLIAKKSIPLANEVNPGFEFQTESVFRAREEQGPGQIETEMRKILSTLEDSKYPDEHFDWGVYDNIARRFKEPPRGGTVFNTTFKLVNHHSSCSKCHYAFELDTYGRGCFHECAYCYAKGQLTSHGFWNRPQPFPVNLAEVRKVFYTVFETDRASRWREVMEQKVPLRIGSMSDSFMYVDSKYGVTKELLRILKFYRYPYVVFTRSDLISHDDYMNELDKNLCAVQFSISGNNQKFIKQIEPGAPSYRRRLNALEKLASNGFWTTVRINPLFPRYPDGYHTDPESVRKRFGSLDNVPVLPFYDDNFIAELAAAKVPSILAGVVRLSSWAVNSMSKATGLDVKKFFLPEVLEAKGDNHFSDRENRFYYRWICEEARRHNIRFSTCYIGNGLKDYFQYQSLWSNKAKDCCDIIGNVKTFKTTSQTVPWDARIKHAPCKSAAELARQADEQVEDINSKDHSGANINSSVISVINAPN